MHFDGLFRRSKSCGDLLVQLAGNDVLQYLTLARRELAELAFERPLSVLDLSRRSVLLLGAGDRSKQLLTAHGFGEKIDCAPLHGLHGGRDVAIPGQENNGSINAVLSQTAL